MTFHLKFKIDNQHYLVTTSGSETMKRVTLHHRYRRRELRPVLGTDEKSYLYHLQYETVKFPGPKFFDCLRWRTENLVGENLWLDGLFFKLIERPLRHTSLGLCWSSSSHRVDSGRNIGRVGSTVYIFSSSETRRKRRIDGRLIVVHWNSVNSERLIYWVSNTLLKRRLCSSNLTNQCIFVHWHCYRILRRIYSCG